MPSLLLIQVQDVAAVSPTPVIEYLLLADDLSLLREWGAENP
ncbi:hypothetical protein ACNKHW_13185 [Shigella flexneri]